MTIDQAEAVINSACPDATFLLSFSGTDNSVTSFLVDCTDAANPGGIVPGGYTVYLYSGTTVIDSCGNFLQVLDGANHCPAPFTSGGVVGRVFTEDDNMIPEVMVELEGSDMPEYMTNAEGFYAFDDVAFGESYMVVPEKDKDYLDGVSTLDLILIQRHILGIEKLDSPYKIIAADINRNDVVNGLDLVELRKLVLGIYDELPNNTSWRIVDASHDFVEPGNPFISVIPEDYLIRNHNTPMTVDFIGVKIGDVNNSVRMGIQGTLLDKRTSSEFHLRVPENEFDAGLATEIIVSADDISDINGFQYTVSVDQSYAEIIEFNPLVEGMTMANVNMNNIEHGFFNLSWNANTEMMSNEIDLFSITIRMKDQASTSTFLSIDEDGLSPEAYTDGEIYGIALDYVEDDNDEMVMLYQNAPNPWKTSTDIKFVLPSDARVLFAVYDVNGQMVRRTEIDAVEGDNWIYLDKGDLPSGGIYYYELITGELSLTQKMIFIH